MSLTNLTNMYMPGGKPRTHARTHTHTHTRAHTHIPQLLSCSGKAIAIGSSQLTGNMWKGELALYADSSAAGERKKASAKASTETGCTLCSVHFILLYIILSSVLFLFFPFFFSFPPSHRDKFIECIAPLPVLLFEFDFKNPCPHLFLSHDFWFDDLLINNCFFHADDGLFAYSKVLPWHG